jgi:hypothetical protein
MLTALAGKVKRVINYMLRVTAEPYNGLGNQRNGSVGYR